MSTRTYTRFTDPSLFRLRKLHQYRAALELLVRSAARLCLPHPSARLEPRARNAILPALSVPHTARAAVRLDRVGVRRGGWRVGRRAARGGDRKSTRLNSSH